MENILYTSWDVLDTLIQVFIYLAIVFGIRRIVKVLLRIESRLSHK